MAPAAQQIQVLCPGDKGPGSVFALDVDRGMLLVCTFDLSLLLRSLLGLLCFNFVTIYFLFI